MKKNKINRNELLQVLNNAVRVAEKKSYVPILTTARLDFKDYDLQITTTNLDTSFRSRIEGVFSEDESVCVDCQVLRNLISKIDDELIEIEVPNEKELTVKFLKGEISLQTHKVDDFPILDFGKKEDYIYKFKSSELLTAFQLSGFALTNEHEIVSTWQKTGELKINTNLIESKFNLISTNGHILSFVRGLCEKKDGASDGSLSIPKNVITQLFSILSSQKVEDVFISEDKNHIFVNTDSCEYSFRKSTHQFPNVSKVTDLSYPLSFELNSKEFKDSIQRLLIVADSRTRSCRFDVEHGVLTLTAKQSDVGEITEEIEIKNGDTLATGFDLVYLENIFSRAEENALLQFNQTEEEISGKIINKITLKTSVKKDAIEADFYIMALTI